MHLTIDQFSDAIPFSEALDEFGKRFSAPSVGFAYTPSQAPWFSSRDGDWLTREGNPVPSTAFELRVFNNDAEMRWQRTTGFNQGTAVILSERQPANTADGTEASRFGDRTLCLWGASAGESANGWTNLSENRIGDRVWVPLGGVGKGATVHLVVREYATRDCHGNIAVVEQVLCGLSVQPVEGRT